MAELKVTIVSGGWPENTQGILNAIRTQLTDGGVPFADVDILTSSGQVFGSNGLEGKMQQARNAGANLVITTDSRAHRFITNDWNIPIVALATDGDRSGRTRPPMLTGFFAPELLSFLNSQLTYLQTLVEGLHRITILHYTNQRKAGAADNHRDMAAALIRNLGLEYYGEIRLGPLVDTGNVDAIRALLGAEFEALDRRRRVEVTGELATDGLVVLPSAVVSYYRHDIITNANRIGLKAIYPLTSFARDGGLLSYAPRRDDQIRAMGDIIKRILGGLKVDPRDIPLESGLPYELSINLGTANDQQVGVDRIEQSLRHRYDNQGNEVPEP